MASMRSFLTFGSGKEKLHLLSLTIERNQVHFIAVLAISNLVLAYQDICYCPGHVDWDKELRGKLYQLREERKKDCKVIRKHCKFTLPNG